MEIEALLDKVENIVRQNEELSALKGENFNIFQLFDLESDENKMHSQFIKTLLNPKGTHGRGTVFLKLFLDTIDFSAYFESLDNVRTKAEHDIGRRCIKGMDSTGGRIDIYLWDGKKSISIENKIHAPDQEKQLVRYWNYQKDTNTVFYLNLYGTPPEGDFSRGDLKSNMDEGLEVPDFYCISYSETILDWLVRCQKEASDFPVVRETIKQYIFTIKRITGQLTNQKMSSEIDKIIADNYKSARLIANKIEKVQIQIIDCFLEDLKISIIKELGKEWDVDRDDVRRTWSKLRVSHKDWMASAAITLEAESCFWKHAAIIGLPSARGSEIRSKIESSIDDSELQTLRTNYPKESSAWFFYKPVFNLSNDNHFSKLLNDEEKTDFINGISLKIIELARMLEMPLKNDPIDKVRS